MPALADFPRVTLGHLPTPLEPAQRLAHALGGPRLWLKRDDCTGLATGGNKTRKLEFLLADALAQGADTVITFGALQSNHARQTAAACARLGLSCELVLSHRVALTSDDYSNAGNLQLDELCGARVHRVDPRAADATYRTITAELRAAGRRGYAIPAGGSNPLGALGYVACFAELQAQCAARGITPRAIVHASSSGGTQAGLVAGALCARRAGHAVPEIIGINTYSVDHAAQQRTIDMLVDGVLALLGEPAAAPGAVCLEHDYLGEDYGLPTDAMQHALRQVARTEGVLLDPVYSGKAMAGLFGLIASGRFRPDDDIVFLHTGGAAALGAYWSTLTTDSPR